VHATAQWSLRLGGAGGPDALGTLMARWRAAPPEKLAGLAVSSVRDLAEGDGDLPPSDVVVLEVGELGRIVLRPSGTEPKLKVYFEATTAPCRREELPAARGLARSRLCELRGAVAELTERHRGAVA
jgi:phosphomannomutase